MTNILMTVGELKDQYEELCCFENNRRLQINELRRILSKVSRDRKAAYRTWQAALKEREEEKAAR